MCCFVENPGRIPPQSDFVEHPIPTVLLIDMKTPTLPNTAIAFLSDCEHKLRKNEAQFELREHSDMRTCCSDSSHLSQFR
jgi:hypothetical protein